MGISVDLEKVNFNDFVNELMKNFEKINNKDLLEKIILEFANKVGDDLVILHNEYCEDGICTWNMCTMIREIFNLTEDEDPYEVYLHLRETLIKYREIDEAYENLNLERKYESEE